MPLTYEDLVIQSDSQQFRRKLIPLSSLLVIIVTTAVLVSQSNDGSNNTDNEASSFAGPSSACSSWSRSLYEDGCRSTLIESDALSDSNGDWFFADATSLTTVNFSEYGDFRLRKLSSGGIDVAKAPLFAQAAPSVMVDDVSPHRLYVMLALHEPSGTVVVLQSGRIGSRSSSNESLYPPISTLALHSTRDGFCAWASNFTRPEKVVYGCAQSDEAPSSMVNFVPASVITSRTVFSNVPTSSSCLSWVFLLGSASSSSSSDRVLTPQISGYFINYPCASTSLVDLGGKRQDSLLSMSSSSLSSSFTSSPSSSSPPTSLHSLPPLSTLKTTMLRHHHTQSLMNEQFIPQPPTVINDNIISKASLRESTSESTTESTTEPTTEPTNESTTESTSEITSYTLPGDAAGRLSFGWTTGELNLPCSTDSEVPCASWDSSYGVSLTSTALFESADESIFFASFPTYKLDPWPNASASIDSNTRLYSEILAIDVTGVSGYIGERWKLSTDLYILDTPVLLTAVISNIVVSDSGELYFAAVRNATGDGDFGGWERVLLSVNGKSGEVIWIYPSKGDLLDPSPRIKSNDELHLLTLSLTESSLIFCGLRPRNGTVNNVGLGAVDTSDGALLWRDAKDFSAVYPQSDADRMFNPTRPSFCASNILADDSFLYTTVAGQPRVLSTEGGKEEDEEDEDNTVTVEYVIYARNVRDGSLLWSELVGTASLSGESLTNGSASSISPSDGTFPTSGSSADFWSALLPFDLATAPNRRLLVKYDSLSLSGNPGSPSSNIDLSVSVFSLHCSNESRSLASALFAALFVGTLASLLIFRCFFGLMWALVSTKTFNIKALRADALRKAAETALASISTNHLPPLNSSSNSFSQNKGERPLSPLAREDDAVGLSSDATTSGGTGKFRQREVSNDSAGSAGSSGQDPLLTVSDEADALPSPSGSGNKKNKRVSQKRSSRSSRSVSTVSSLEEIGGASDSSVVRQQQNNSNSSRRRRSLSGSGKSSSRSSVESGGSSGSRSVFIGGTRDTRGRKERKRQGDKSISPSSSTGSLIASSLDANNDENPASFGVAEPIITLTGSLDSSYRDSLDGLLVVDFLKGQTVDRTSSSSSSSLFSSLFFMRSGTPWVLISVLHTFSILVALSLSVAQSSATISTLQLSLLDPLAFYNTYLINRSPDTDTICPSQAAAACYCTSPSSSGSDSSLTSLCSTTGTTCDFDLSPCRSMCSSVLESTGSCAASVLMFSCSCANDCINTQLFFNSTSVASHPLTASGGLVEGLATCRAHYTTLNAVLVGALIAYAVLAGATFFSHFRLGSLLNILFTEAEKRAYMNADGTSSKQAALLSIDESKQRSSDKKGRRGGASSSSFAKRGASKGDSLSEKVGETLIYISLWKAVVLGGGLLWASFLVLQGRYCTGIDGQVTGGGTPIVGNSLPPKDSLILRNAPGCAFGAAWQNVDLEGKVLSTVYLSILSLLAALILSLSDQILLLLLACFHRCNSVGVKRTRIAGQQKEEGGGSSSFFPSMKAGKNKVGMQAPRILCSCSSRGQVTCARNTSNIVKTPPSISSSSSSSSGANAIEKPFNTDLLFVPESWVDLSRYPPRRIDCCVRKVSLLQSSSLSNRSGLRFSQQDDDKDSNDDNRKPLRNSGEGDYDDRDYNNNDEEEIMVGIIITIPGLIQFTIGMPLVV